MDVEPARGESEPLPSGCRPPWGLDRGKVCDCYRFTSPPFGKAMLIVSTDRINSFTWMLLPIPGRGRVPDFFDKQFGHDWPGSNDWDKAPPAGNYRQDRGPDP